MHPLAGGDFPDVEHGRIAGVWANVGHEELTVGRVGDVNRMLFEHFAFVQQLKRFSVPDAHRWRSWPSFDRYAAGGDGLAVRAKGDAREHSLTAPSALDYHFQSAAHF